MAKGLFILLCIIIALAAGGFSVYYFFTGKTLEALYMLAVSAYANFSVQYTRQED